MEDTIVKQISIKAPVSKVWKALTDSQLFGRWFKAEFKGPFVAGQTAQGRNTHPGFEFEMNFFIQDITPESYFSYRWIPFPVDRTFDYTKEEPTLVEFHLEETTTGTLLKVTESGFTKVTASRRAKAIAMHTGGWEAQLKNIGAFVEGE